MPSANDMEKAKSIRGAQKEKEPLVQSSPIPEKEPEAPGIYKGTIELAIPPPIGLDRMLQLHKHLKQTPQVEVLNLGGSVDKGITIRLLLENPTPLLKVLEDLPEVQKVSDETPGSEKMVPSRETGDASHVKRILVITKE